LLKGIRRRLPDIALYLAKAGGPRRKFTDGRMKKAEAAHDRPGLGYEISAEDGLDVTGRRY
jgi:hypothetical protein